MVSLLNMVLFDWLVLKKENVVPGDAAARWRTTLRSGPACVPKGKAATATCLAAGGGDAMF